MRGGQDVWDDRALMRGRDRGGGQGDRKDHDKSPEP